MIIRFHNFILSMKGFTVVRLREYSQAVQKIDELNQSVHKSGHLNELIRRKPKIVRKIDMLTAEALTNLTNSQTSENRT